MVYRNSVIAVIAAITYLLWQLNELLRPSSDSAPWQGVVLVSLALGALITSVLLRYRMGAVAIAGVHGVALLWTVLQTAAPTTLAFTLPTGATIPAVRDAIAEAMRIISGGVEPVTPVPGLVAMVSVLFWVLGAVVVAGLRTRRPMLALVPPLIISLQFAVMNRSHTGPLGAALFLGIVAFALLAVNIDERSASAGRMAPRGAYAVGPVRVGPMGILSLAVVLLLAVGATDRLDSRVPNGGVVDWRSSTGLPGGIFGGISYNPYIGIRQQLVAPSGVPILEATIEGVPADQVYFRLTTMEKWNGTSFFASDAAMRALDADWLERPSLAFAGESTPISGTVTIGALRSEWIPVPNSVSSVTTENVIGRDFRARAIDGAIVVVGGRTTYGGLTYNFEGAIPNIDYASLATQADGEFSPVFAKAVADGRVVGEPSVTAERAEAPDLEPFLDLGDNPDLRIAEYARDLTKNMTNDFEKSLALETALRKFEYSTALPLGGGATNLGDWLTAPDSPNFQTGYCEQFATGMAVMARALGIPSRVVLGFAPGKLIKGSTNTVVVTDAQAHAWVEVWLEPHGWTRFDPTPRGGIYPTAQGVSDALGFDIADYFDVEAPVLDNAQTARPNIFVDETDSSQQSTFIGSGGSATSDGSQLPSWTRNAGFGLLLVVLLIGAVPMLKWRRRRGRMKRLATGDITAAWDELVARLDDLNESPSIGATPAEAAANVDPAMVELANVYAKSVYGGIATLKREDVDTARRALDATKGALRTRHGRRTHLRALYRLSSLRRRR